MSPETLLLAAIWRELNLGTEGAGMVKEGFSSIGVRGMAEISEREPVLVKMVQEYLAGAAAGDRERLEREFGAWLKGNPESNPAVYAWQRRADFK